MHDHSISAKEQLKTIFCQITTRQRSNITKIIWPDLFAQKELSFLSQVCFNKHDCSNKSIIYLSKELLVISELKKQFTTLLLMILSELQDDQYHELNQWHYLHQIITHIATDSLNHADISYHYIRILSQKDLKLSHNLLQEKIKIYQGSESAWVKLSALCIAEYICITSIACLQKRCHSLDPDDQYYLTRFLTLLDMDAHWHKYFFKFVFSMIAKQLTAEENIHTIHLLKQTRHCNQLLSEHAMQRIMQSYNDDYLTGNISFQILTKLILSYYEFVFNLQDLGQVDLFQIPR